MSFPHSIEQPAGICPNLPDRGVRTDVSWLQTSLPQADYQKVQEENVDNQRAQTAHGIQARNLAKLNAAVNEALKSPELQSAFERLAIESRIGSPDAFAAFVAKEREKWGGVIKAADVRAE